jgi:hypothetical protein
MAASPDEIRLTVRYAPFHRGSDEVVKVLEATSPLRDRLIDIGETRMKSGKACEGGRRSRPSVRRYVLARGQVRRASPRSQAPGRRRQNRSL